MNVDKLKIGDEVYFPKNDTVSQITERIGKLVCIDNQTLSALKYGFDFGEGFQGNRLMANNEGFSIPNPTGIWLAESKIKQGHRVYSGKNLKKIKPGDTVRIINQINKEMIGNVFVVQRGYKEKGFYNDAVSQQLKLIRISKRYKYKEPSPTSQQGTTDMDDQQIESEIQAKGLNAPRVTPQDIEANIIDEQYFTAMDGAIGANGSPVWETEKFPHDALRLLTFCVLVLQNGFTVTGESACASPENLDAATGRKRARQNAVNKIWPLMGYALKQRLHETKE